MCGIVGYLGSKKLSKDQLIHSLHEMTNELVHRGPDDMGVWFHDDFNVGLGHRRLAIQDVSQDGAQPMRSSCGRYVLVFNGEIYNFIELREELVNAGCSFHGGADTEVMLVAMIHWGVNIALEKFNGMFAFALWDNKKNSLTLGRDRIGKKPIYYGYINNNLVFASEIKSLQKWSGFETRVDSDSAASFFQYGFVSGHRSIFSGIKKLPAGHLLTVDLYADNKTSSYPYWDLSSIITNSSNHKFTKDFDAALDELDKLLLDSVRLRYRADVPVGVFLSGGIDSSLVSAMLQKQCNSPIKSFTIGFEDSNYDESSGSSNIAKKIGTDHTSLILSSSDVKKIVPDLPIVYDEPFADVSQIPTLLVSKLAKNNVTVCLSGDGGDESFGGYNRHFLAEKYWPKLAKVPYSLRKLLSSAGHGIGFSNWEKLYKLISRFNGGQGSVHKSVERLLKTFNAIGARDELEMYDILLSHGMYNDALFKQHKLFSFDERKQFLKSVHHISIAEKIMSLDSQYYLPDDILVKVDRASMYVSLEVRAPLLDHRVIEFAWNLPLAWKLNNGQGKIILRKLLSRYLPEALFEGPKMGFSVPISEWLRGPLKEWAYDIIFSSSLQQDDWLDYSILQKKWQAHVNREQDYGPLIWRALMWETWKRQWF